MSPRPYRLGKRAESVEQTRARIVAVTRQLLAREVAAPPSIEEVARRADVARTTVYYQFGSKTGLLEAVVQDIQRAAGQTAVVNAVELADPVQALRSAVLAGCHFWAAEHHLIRRLTGLATIDLEVRRVLADVQRARLPLVTELVERLGAAGRLSPTCPADRAVDLLWMLGSFEAFDQLFTVRQRSIDDVADLLADLAVGELTGRA